jgi:Na+/pantothenate symporter
MSQTRNQQLEEKIEKSFIAWVKNDRFFDGFRNTYGRILIVGLTWVGLYILGAYAFITPGGVNWYVAALIVLALMNQLSVRFAFNVDHEKQVADEYQAKRRDAAYRHAYRNVSSQLIAGLVLFFATQYFWGNSTAANVEFPAAGQLEIWLHFNAEQIIVLGAFFVGLFGLQKYISWGFKGEPWLSKNETP